jgi:hypothetical protein
VNGSRLHDFSTPGSTAADVHRITGTGAPIDGFECIGAGNPGLAPLGLALDRGIDVLRQQPLGVSTQKSMASVKLITSRRYNY